MRRSRQTQFLILVALLALIAVIAKSPVKDPKTKRAVPAQSTQVEKEVVEPVFPPTVLRWSSRDGCFADADFYFELRTDASGASWIALLSAYGTWQENLIEGRPKSKRVPGNFLSSGRLSPSETSRLVEKLVLAKATEVRSADFHTGPTLSLYIKLGDEENKVASFQSEFDPTDSPECRLSDFLYSCELFDKEWNPLRARFDQGEIPDYPLMEPGLYWLTKGEETLFGTYPELLQEQSSKGWQ